MIGINCNKDKMTRMFEAVKTGQPILDVKTLDDMLALAGVCHAIVFSHGPWNRKDLDKVFTTKGIPQERKEAIEETMDQDIHDAIGWYSMVAFKIVDGEYDAQLESEHRAALYRDGEGKKVIRPISGFKGTKEEYGSVDGR